MELQSHNYQAGCV